MRRLFAELPSDLDVQDETMGPPPSWFPARHYVSSNLDPSLFPWYSPAFYGLGDREQEVEVNPVEILQELKFKQEMPKKIPVIASRYTEIDPLSPMFRQYRPKYGYGDFTAEDGKVLIKVLAAVAVIYYFLLRKKR